MGEKKKKTVSEADANHRSKVEGKRGGGESGANTGVIIRCKRNELK